MATAIFAAGCFWGVEASFRKLAGVIDTEVGYIGGDVANPSYKDVCTGRTGHAEAVRIEYDPDRITYDDLLACFWSCHDPTQINRQGPDIGTQYRSAIFVINATQKNMAVESRAREDASGRHPSSIATEIVTAGPFWPAESYHQKYLEKRSGAAPCR